MVKCRLHKFLLSHPVYKLFQDLLIVILRTVVAASEFFPNVINLFFLIQDEEEDFGTHKFAKYQKMIWDLIEHPDTSMAAQVYYLS